MLKHNYFLQDFYHSSDILQFKAQHIAIACIELAIKVYGIPSQIIDYEIQPWYQVCIYILLLFWYLIVLISKNVFELVQIFFVLAIILPKKTLLYCLQNMSKN